MQENFTIVFEGGFRKDLRDIAFATAKISRILNRTGYALASKEELDRQHFKINAEIKEGSLVIEIAIFLASLYPDMISYTPKEIFVNALEFVKLLSGLYDQMNDRGSDNNIIQEVRDGNVIININNSNIQNSLITVPAPAYRTAMASESEIKAINKKITDGELMALKVDGAVEMDANSVGDVEKGLKVINHLKNMPIEEICRAEIEVYEYNKKNFSGKAHLKSTDLFRVKKHKSIDFYFVDTEIESSIIESLYHGKVLLVEFKPIILDMVEYKELKKMQIVSVKEVLNI